MTTFCSSRQYWLQKKIFICKTNQIRFCGSIAIMDVTLLHETVILDSSMCSLFLYFHCNLLTSYIFGFAALLRLFPYLRAVLSSKSDSCKISTNNITGSICLPVCIIVLEVALVKVHCIWRKWCPPCSSYSPTFPSSCRKSKTVWIFARVKEMDFPPSYTFREIKRLDFDILKAIMVSLLLNVALWKTQHTPCANSQNNLDPSPYSSLDGSKHPLLTSCFARKKPYPTH